MRAGLGWISGLLLLELSGISMADDGMPARLHTALWHGPANSINVDGVCAGDLDGDGSIEVATLSATWLSADTEESQAELQIARWDGEDYRQLAGESWQLPGETTRTRDVICHALDADIGQEVVTVAHAGPRSEVRIWSWDGL